MTQRAAGTKTNSPKAIISRYTEFMSELVELDAPLASRIPPLPPITPVLVRAYQRGDVAMVQHLVRQRPWYPSPTTPWEILGRELTPDDVFASQDRIYFSGHMYAVTIKLLIEAALEKQMN
jgi:hypothetical protein